MSVRPSMEAGWLRRRRSLGEGLYRERVVQVEGKTRKLEWRMVNGREADGNGGEEEFTGKERELNGRRESLKVRRDSDLRRARLIPVT